MQTKAETARQTTRLSRIIASYTLLPNASSASRQLSELTRTIPFFLFFHLSAAVSVNVMVLGLVPQLLLGLWQAVVLLTAGVFIWAIHLGRKTAFIGESLTLRMIGELWPKLSLADLEISRKDNYEKTA